MLKPFRKLGSVYKDIWLLCSVKPCYNDTTAAYIPKKYHDKILFPANSSKVLIEDFKEEEPFVSISVKSVFQDSQLINVQIICVQEGSDLSIEITPF